MTSKNIYIKNMYLFYSIYKALIYATVIIAIFKVITLSQFCKRRVKSTILKLKKKPLKFQSKLSN